MDAGEAVAIAEEPVALGATELASAARAGARAAIENKPITRKRVVVFN
jgi:hypothetical protein